MRPAGVAGSADVFRGRLASRAFVYQSSSEIRFGCAQTLAAGRQLRYTFSAEAASATGGEAKSAGS